MTIYGVGYRTLEYQPTSWFARVGAIASLEFKKPFRTRWGVILFILAFWYVVVKIGAMYFFLGTPTDLEGEAMRRAMEMFASSSPGARALLNPFVPAFYFDHALEHGFLVFLVLTSLVSVRAIAGDRGTNGLEIYWTRSISPLGYFLGKWLGSFLLLGAVFFGGSLFCWFFSQLIAPDWDYLGYTIAYVPLVLGVLFLQCLVLSFVAVGFSALMKSANVAVFIWIGVLVGAKFVAALLGQIARAFSLVAWDEAVWFDAIWIWDAVNRICYHLMGETRPVRWPDDYHLGAAWCSVAIYLAAVLVILWRQLRTEKGVA